MPAPYMEKFYPAVPLIPYLVRMTFFQKSPAPSSFGTCSVLVWHPQMSKKKALLHRHLAPAPYSFGAHRRSRRPKPHRITRSPLLSSTSVDPSHLLSPDLSLAVFLSLS
ncbi:hypothetical protein ACLOJK_005103 [Asimina triloba]